MQRSSCRRFFHKRVFPFLWFGAGSSSPSYPGADSRPGAAPFSIAAGAAVIGYLAWRKFVADLAGEVWDGGDWLLVRKDGREERIPFSNIINVNAVLFANPPRITLRLANSGIFGREVAFSATRSSSSPFAGSPLVEDLILRSTGSEGAEGSHAVEPHPVSKRKHRGVDAPVRAFFTCSRRGTMVVALALCEERKRESNIIVWRKDGEIQ